MFNFGSHFLSTILLLIYFAFSCYLFIVLVCIIINENLLCFFILINRFSLQILLILESICYFSLNIKLKSRKLKWVKKKFTFWPTILKPGDVNTQRCHCLSTQDLFLPLLKKHFRRYSLLRHFYLFNIFFIFVYC